MGKRLVPADGSYAPSTRAIVDPSSERPAGTGSRPTIGSRQWPAIVRDGPSPPDSTSTSRTTVEAPSTVAVTTRRQSGDGAPPGTGIMTSLVVDRMTRRSASPVRPTRSQALPASSGLGVSSGSVAVGGAAGRAVDVVGPVDCVDRAALPTTLQPARA